MHKTLIGAIVLNLVLPLSGWAQTQKQPSPLGAAVTATREAPRVEYRKLTVYDH